MHEMHISCLNSTVSDGGVGSGMDCAAFSIFGSTKSSLTTGVARCCI